MKNPNQVNPITGHTQPLTKSALSQSVVELSPGDAKQELLDFSHVKVGNYESSVRPVPQLSQPRTKALSVFRKTKDGRGVAEIFAQSAASVTGTNINLKHKYASMLENLEERAQKQSQTIKSAASQAEQMSARK